MSSSEKKASASRRARERRSTAATEAPSSSETTATTTLEELQEQRRQRQERIARIAGVDLALGSTTGGGASAMIRGPLRATSMISTASSGAGTSTTISHEDEIERIREMRARRLQKEREMAEQGGESDAGDVSTTSSDSRYVAGSSIRERRRSRPTTSSTDTNTSSPVFSTKSRTLSSISRADLEASSSRRSGTSPRRALSTTDDDGYLSRSSRRGGLRDSGDEHSPKASSKRLSSKTFRKSIPRRGSTTSVTDAVGRDDVRQAALLAYGDSSSAAAPDAPSSNSRYQHRAGQDMQLSAPSSESLTAKLKERREARTAVAERRLHRHRSGDSTSSGSSLGRMQQATTMPRDDLEEGSSLRNSRTIERRLSRRNSNDSSLEEASRYLEVERRLSRRKSNDEDIAKMASATKGLETSSRHTNEVERRLARRRSSQDNLRLMQSISQDDDAKALVVSSSLLDLDPPEITNMSDNNDYSIKVKILSAIDLPQNILSNTPLCPVVKVGFVRIPDDLTTSLERATAFVQKKFSESSHTTTSSSLDDLQNSRVRATTCKLMGKRDNGTLDFDQEMRWDSIALSPTREGASPSIALVVEVAARAVRTPANYDQSPPAIHIQSAGGVTTMQLSPEPTKRISTMAAVASNPPRRNNSEDSRGEFGETALSRSASGSDDDVAGGGGLRALWRMATNRKAAELEAAEAAAAVARMIVKKDEDADPMMSASSSSISGLTPASPTPLNRAKMPSALQVDYNVALHNTDENLTEVRLTKDLPLGSLVIPLASLPLREVFEKKSGSTKIEKWYQLLVNEGEDFSHARRKRPSLHLEMTIAQVDYMDDEEEKIDIEEIEGPALNASLGQLSLKDEKESEADNQANSGDKKMNPTLEAGVVDFVAIVGLKDLGNQPLEDGPKGWIENSVESTIFEQFPPDNEFHAKNGRKALLPEMVQWFCFPEGPRMWRGVSPPSHADLNIKRFSASTSPTIASSIAAFDACLDCTTSFSWFVIASNSDEYGSKLVKTYGAVLRFFVQAPEKTGEKESGETKMKIWLPMAICFTSNLPIVGIMEAMTLRLCEDLSSRMNDGESGGSTFELSTLHQSLWDVIVMFPKPIPGAVNCSIPFLSGERFLLSLPPPSGLPPIPYGKAVVSTCRLLGRDGLNFLLAAALTECKILIHSNRIADIAMVAEVVTALLYPFTWSLPYIPVLPLGMLEFVEAPLSYMLGVPTQSLRLMDPQALDDVVVIDLDSGFSSSSSLSRRKNSKVGPNKNTPPLPSQVADNISRAVQKLLRTEEELDMEFGMMNIEDNNLPGLETESLAEREFRVSVAIEICSLLRGYQECTGTVFNRDKFLKVAPALFEDKKNKRGGGQPRHSSTGSVVSPRSKRFLSSLVNTQNFHQFLESLEEESSPFFNEIMSMFDDSTLETSALRLEKNVSHLVRVLQKVEDSVPTFRVPGKEDEPKPGEFIFDDSILEILADDYVFDSVDPGVQKSFSGLLLLPPDSIDKENESKEENESQTPWKYNSLLNISGDNENTLSDKVDLRQAIGDRRYRMWRLEQDKKGPDNLELSFSQTTLEATKRGSALDLTSLVASMSSDTSLENLLPKPSADSLRVMSEDPKQQKIIDAKDRDIIRRCLDKANQKNGEENPFIEKGRDLLSESEKALRNPSAQRFLLSVLGQRTRLESQRARGGHFSSLGQHSVSRLDAVAFDCLVRMSCAILDACMDYKEYEMAYRLLTLTAGFTTIAEDQIDGDESKYLVIAMTSRIAIHPVFANMEVWKTVMNLHIIERQNERKMEARQSDNMSVDSEEDMEDNEAETEYEAAVATLFEMQGYNVPGEELSRFAATVSREKGWFDSDERARQLLVLARRITVRRDQADTGRASIDTSLEITGKSQERQDGADSSPFFAGMKQTVDSNFFENISWCHPAALSNSVGNTSNAGLEDEHMKRSPVTALASFGETVVVSAGLDGSVFLAYSIAGNDNGVQGIHLDWGSASRGSASSSLDGEYGVGK